MPSEPTGRAARVRAVRVGGPEGSIATLAAHQADLEEVTVAVLRLFAGAREAAGTGRDDVPGDRVREVLDAARLRYGEQFSAVLEHCAVWCNGEPCELDQRVGDGDEVAVLPPVSGGGA